jgi:hypothetical protein
MTTRVKYFALGRTYKDVDLVGAGWNLTDRFSANDQMVVTPKGCLKSLSLHCVDGLWVMRGIAYLTGKDVCWEIPANAANNWLQWKGKEAVTRAERQSFKDAGGMVEAFFDAMIGRRKFGLSEQAIWEGAGVTRAMYYRLKAEHRGVKRWREKYLRGIPLNDTQR